MKQVFFGRAKRIGLISLACILLSMGVLYTIFGSAQVDKNTVTISATDKILIAPYLQTAKLYNTAEVSVSEGALRKVAQTKPIASGLTLNYKLDPKQRYLFSISGILIKGEVTLRVDIDEKQFWYQLSNSEFVLPIQNAKKVSIWIYNAHPFEYKVNNLSLSMRKDNDTGVYVTGTNKKISMQHLISAEIFKNTEIELNDEKIKSLAYHGSSDGGIQLNFQLDPEKHYKLKLNGEANVNGLMLRLDKEDKSTWYAISNGGDDFIIDGIKKFSVWIYTTGDFKYEIKEISVNTCKNCNSENDLKKKILTEIPSLATDLKEKPLLAAEKLLNWSANNGVFALYRTVYDNAFQHDVAKAYYSEFSEQTYGVYCGGMGVFTEDVFRLFGYEAFTIDVGYKGSLITHVTVIVAMKDNDGNFKFYLMDPTFNLIFTDKKKGNIQPVKPLLTALAVGDFKEKFQIKAYSLKDRVHLFPIPQSVEEIRKHKTVILDFDCNENIEKNVPRNICYVKGDFYQVFLNDFGEAIEKVGAPRDETTILALLRQELFSTGRGSPEAVQAFNAMLAQVGKEAPSQ